MKTRNLDSRIAQSIAISKADVFLRSDFDKFGGYDQVGRALRSLVAKKKLVKSGYGVYVRAKTSVVTGNTIPVLNSLQVADCVLKKMGVKTFETEAVRRYREGKTTQIPVIPIIDVGKSRISRKIGFAGNFVKFK